ncbi:MAG: SGNH/GDSL hydrolase family protein [Pseudomonadota bacterium]
MQNGIRTTELPLIATLDEVTGNKDGTTSRQTVDSLATQIAGNAAFAALVDDQAQQIYATGGSNSFSITASAITLPGAPAVTPAATLTVAASQVTYLVIDLGSLTYRLLDRVIHSGCVPMAKITADAQAVTSIEELPVVMPQTHLAAVQAKLAAAVGTGNVRAVLLGSSLIAGAGADPKWTALTFESAGGTYRLANWEQIDLRNWAVGGSNIEMGQLFTSEATKPAGGTGAAQALMQMRRTYLRDTAVPVSGDVGLSDLLAQPPDIVLLGYGGANDANMAIEGVENVAVALRRAGIPVAIVTENSRLTPDPTVWAANGLAAAEIAKATGCALIDTHAYIYEAVLQGQDAYDDSIHQSELGHQLYAEAVKSVLEPMAKLQPAAEPTPRRSVFHNESNTNGFGKRGARTHLQFNPTHGISTRETGQANMPTERNAAVFVGGLATETSVIKLQAGEFAQFSHPWWSSVYVVYDPASPAFTAQLSRANGTDDVGDPFSYSGNAVNKHETGMFYSSVNFLTHMHNSFPVRVTCTSGEMWLVCAAFQTSIEDELILADFDYLGTWGTESGNGTLTYDTHFTDTDGDSFSFEFFGSGVLLSMLSGPACGVVDVYLDGRKVIDQMDLYDPASAWKVEQLPVLPLDPVTGAPEYRPKTAKKQVCTVVLNGVNPSAVAPTGLNHRMGIYGAYQLNDWV